jgi:hypothetical protein
LNVNPDIGIGNVNVGVAVNVAAASGDRAIRLGTRQRQCLVEAWPLPAAV